MDGKSRVGLIGLGNAGLALAQPLLKRFEVMGFDLDEGAGGSLARRGSSSRTVRGRSPTSAM